MNRTWMKAGAIALAVIMAWTTPLYAQTEETVLDNPEVSAVANELEQQAEDKKRAEEEARRRRREPNEAKVDLGNEKAFRITWGYWSVEGPDFHQIESAEAGDVIEITISAPAKIWTDADLNIGGTVVEKENVAPDYPGVYSLWLQKSADGWNAIVNAKPDVWGTMYDPSQNVATAPLEYTTAPEAAEEFAIAIKESDAGGTVQMTWGEHQWSLPFTYAE